MLNNVLEGRHFKERQTYTKDIVILFKYIANVLRHKSQLKQRINTVSKMPTNATLWKLSKVMRALPNALNFIDP